MSRTGLSPADIAESFRDSCGDGSMEWVYTPISARVLLDAADMLDENAKLRELVRDVVLLAGVSGCDVTKMQLHANGGDWRTIWERMSELGVPGTEAEP